MAYSNNDLTKEIKDLIASGFAAKRSMPASWITVEILGRYPLPDKFEFEEDKEIDPERVKEFTTLCRWEHVRDEVHQTLRLFDGPQPSSPKQAAFEFLQEGYLTKRDGELAIIRIEEMSDDELEAKAIHYESMGRGCFRHADEIRRYVQQRRKRKRA